jgi:Dynamin family
VRPTILSDPLDRLRQWRQEAAQVLEDLRHWATLSQLGDPNTGARLAHLQRRLSNERLTLAFIGDSGRGKTSLINALLFGDIGVRPLPVAAGRQMSCPLELRYDLGRQPSIRLLPIESRQSGRSLRECMSQEGDWQVIPIDLSATARLPAAFSTLTDTRDATLVEAESLGLPSDRYPVSTNPEAPVRIPRWRYAIANLPHPALRHGLIVLDLPGGIHLQVEPELVHKRIADADAVTLVVDASQGLTETDLSIWNETIAPSENVKAHTLLAWMKRDLLAEKYGDSAEAEMERRALTAVSRLDLPRTRMFTLSVERGGARVTPESPAGTELERFGQTLADSVIASRLGAHGQALQAETGPLLAESRHVLDSRKSFVEGTIAELSTLAAKNKRLMQTLSQRLSEESDKWRQASAMFHEFAITHATYHEELRNILDPKQAHGRTAAMKNQFLLGGKESIDGSLDQYFSEAARRIDAAVVKISEMQTMIAQVNRAFSLDFQMRPVEVPPFSTTRFAGELTKISAQNEQDFKGGMRSFSRRESLADHWEEDIGERVDHIFEIGYREANVWLNSLTRELEAELAQVQVHLTTRLENMQRLHEADNELKAKVAEVSKTREALVEQRDQLSERARRVARLLERSAERRM